MGEAPPFDSHSPSFLTVASFSGGAAVPQLSFLNSQFCFCNTVIGIYQKDFSTLPHILFLRFSIISTLTTARNDGVEIEFI